MISPNLLAAPAFDTVNAESFFTNVASRLLAREMNLGLSRIQIYPTNEYTPAVHRLLQVTANIYEATTTNAFPSVFRPLFSSDATGTSIFITGYQRVGSVSGISDEQLAAPVAISALTLSQTPFTNRAVNLYGVPWIIGARKGLPNFNQFYMRSLAQISRKLQVTRADAARPGALATNQMFLLSITNRIGFSFWNSYNADYVPASGSLTVYCRDIVSVTLSNSVNRWQSFYGSPSPVQYAFATNLSIWPGSAWTNSGPSLPPDQTANPGSFISGFWDFTFLPPSAYVAITGDFVPLADASFETGLGYVPPLPQFGLMTTNWLQAFILDGTNVIDYVQFSGPDSVRNLTWEIADTGSAFAGYWNTNPWGGGVSPLSPSWGVVNQINTAQNLSNQQNWIRPSDVPPFLTTPTLVSAYFRSFFTGTPIFINGKYYVNTNLAMIVPYTPERFTWKLNLWQANDPLVHYITSDLTSASPYAGLHRADSLTSSGFSYSNPKLNQVVDRYQPWGRYREMSAVIGVDQNGYYDLRLHDPLVWGSDDWNFPTGQNWNLNWLGRVHRGTPWQTIYLKSADILKSTATSGPDTINVGTNTWRTWTGNLNPQDASLNSPLTDRQLVSDLASILNTNDLQALFSVNTPGVNAWAALMDGMTVLTNSTEVPVPPFAPIYESLVLTSNSQQAAAIATALCTSQAFENIGDILAVPELSDLSPFLNRSDYIIGSSDRLRYDISDEAYEIIPSQLLPLLRADSIGAMISTNGEWRVQFTGYDDHAYAIQNSADLVNWSNISTNTPTNGIFHFAPPVSGSIPRQFYRSILLQ